MKSSAQNRLRQGLAHALLAGVFLCGRGFAQTPDEVRQFVAGSIADKTRVIRGIDPLQPPPEQVRQLPQEAIDFVLAYREVLGDTPDIENLFLASVEKLNSADTTKDISLLVYLLSKFNGGKPLDAIMRRLHDLAAVNPQAIKQAAPGLNDFLRQNAARFSGAGGAGGAAGDAAAGAPENADVIRLAIETLSLAGDSSSFFAFLPYAVQTRSKDVAQAAAWALNDAAGGFEDNALRALSENPPAEKLFVLRMIQKNSNFSSDFKAKSAEIGLSQAITIAEKSGGAFPPEVIALQTEALGAIVKYDWTPASALVLALFPVARSEYAAGAMKELDFIAVIKAASALGVSGAGRVLSNYLAELNSVTVSAGLTSGAPDAVSPAVVLALINTLGDLGDKTAFDDLLYVTYLDYDREIIQSAKDALEKLKLQW